jgi:hypothetical protein
MRAEVFKDLLTLLGDCDVEPRAKADFRKLIEAVGFAHGVTISRKPDRIAFARQLLTSGVPRTEIRSRLMARFEIGESQAYRDIGDALQIVPISAGAWDSNPV